MVLLAGRFVALLLAAQALGAREFGLFAVIQSGAAFIERFFNAQSWQLLVKRLAHLASAKGDREMAPVVGAAIAADLSGGLLAFLSGMVCLEIFGPGLGLSEPVKTAAQIYCGIVFLNAHGAWAGVLRAFGKYGLYASYQMLSGFGVVAVLAYFRWLSPGAQPDVILYGWIIAELSAYGFLVAAATVVVRRAGFRFLDLAGCLREVWRELRAGSGFLLSTNLASSLRMATKEGDVLVVGAMVSMEAAGAYKIGRNFAILPLLVTDSLYYLAYPKLAALYASQQIARFRALVRHACMLGAAVGIVAVVAVWGGGARLLELLSIEDPLVFRVMCICIIATSLATATFPFAPALMASGDHRRQVTSLIAGTIAFFATALATLRDLGAVGAALASVAFYVVWIAVVAPRLFNRGVL